MGSAIGSGECGCGGICSSSRSSASSALARSVVESARSRAPNRQLAGAPGSFSPVGIRQPPSMRGGFVPGGMTAKLTEREKDSCRAPGQKCQWKITLDDGSKYEGILLNKITGHREICGGLGGGDYSEAGYVRFYSDGGCVTEHIEFVEFKKVNLREVNDFLSWGGSKNGSFQLRGQMFYYSKDNSLYGVLNRWLYPSPKVRLGMDGTRGMKITAQREGPRPFNWRNGGAVVRTPSGSDNGFMVLSYPSGYEEMRPFDHAAWDGYIPGKMPRVFIAAADAGESAFRQNTLGWKCIPTSTPPDGFCTP